MAQFSLGSWMGCSSMKIYLHLSGSCSKWYVLYWQPHCDMVSENYVKSFLWNQWRWINMFNLLLTEFQAYLHCFIFYWLVKLSIFLFNKAFKIEYKFDIKDVKRYFFKSLNSSFFYLLLLNLIVCFAFLIIDIIFYFVITVNWMFWIMEVRNGKISFRTNKYGQFN